MSVPSSLPLLHGYEADAPIGWRGGARVTAARFCMAVHEFAQKLPRARYVVNLCDDRLNFMLGFAAALVAGRTSLLPPSRAAGVVREIAATYPDTCCLADHDELPAALPAMILPAWATAGAGRFDVPRIPTEQVAMIVFTSGTTGRPQPHAKSWGSLVAGARGLGRRLGISGGEQANLLGTVPPQHMYGLETTVMLPLQNGIAVHGARPLLPADIGLALAEMPAPRWLATTPLQLRTALGEGARYPAMAGIMSATMALAPELARAIEERWAVPLHEIYGCTEAGTVGLRRPAKETRWHTCEGLRLRQKAGVTRVEGGHLDAELELPDCLEIVNEEEFLLIGRPADMIKIAGKRASLEALTCELLRVPGVRDGAFFLPENGVAGAQRVAALAVAPGIAPGVLLRALREHVDPAFLPRPLIMVDALPRSATGKLAREGLLALAQDALARDRRRA